MSDEKQRPGQRPTAEEKQRPSQGHTAEELRELLHQRRPLNKHDDFYDHPLCPCEEIEPENQSEYDVAGDWVTYDGPINKDIFEHASRNAAQDLEAQMREFYKEPVAPPTSSAQAQAPADALKAHCSSSSQSSRAGAVTAAFADAQAAQAKDGGVAHAKITSAETQAVREASGTEEVLNE